MHPLVKMLSYKRPEGSKTQQEFCNLYLKPVFGNPDTYGNYIKIVGRSPNVCFTAHHDTVHLTDGKQIVSVRNDIATLPTNSNSNCLGADCTSGIYLILEMIKANVEGVYVIHAGEELGCMGSRALVKSDPQWLYDLDAVISFDRKGQESIITHQMGMRTCSDAFAISLDVILGMGHRPDDTGSYTDSNEYAGIVPECTNLSVGYLAQHTAKESQDLYYLDYLKDNLIAADWSKLSISRNPHDKEYLSLGGWGSYGSSINEETDGSDIDDLYDLVRDYPMQIAEWLHNMNVKPSELVEELQLPIVGSQINRWF